MPARCRHAAWGRGTQAYTLKALQSVPAQQTAQSRLWGLQVRLLRCAVHAVMNWQATRVAQQRGRCGWMGASLSWTAF